MDPRASLRGSRPGRARLVLAASLLAGAALGACGGSSSPATSVHPAQAATEPRGAASATSNTVTQSAGGVTATLRAAGHEPTANRPWPLHFTVTRGGSPAQASVSYEYLFGGQVVARRDHYSFHGSFSDVFHWPSNAVGYPLTFRAIVVSGDARIALDYPVQVKR
jgi:hypothetical protein